MTRTTWRILRFECTVEGIHEIQFTALVANKIIGRVGVKCRTTDGRALDIASIRQLYVAPAHRRQGLGMELVDKCRSEAHAAGCYSINLTVAACNREVLPWYLGQGFIPAHVYEDGEALLVRALNSTQPKPH